MKQSNQENNMEQLYITVKDGKAVKNKSASAACLSSQVDVERAIKPMSAKQLTEFYKSLTGKVVKRFASKGDAAKRIHKFIQPSAGGKKSGAPVKAKKKAPATVNKALGKTKRVDIKTKTIKPIPHDSKTFQKGSVREKCYNIVMESKGSGSPLKVTDYVTIAKRKNIDESTALACLKKLCQVGQKVQTMELV